MGRLDRIAACRADPLRYREATVAQLLRWHNGQRVHNAISGECCPDFSCCYPDMYETDPETRMRWVREAIARRDELKPPK